MGLERLLSVFYCLPNAQPLPKAVAKAERGLLATCSTDKRQVVFPYATKVRLNKDANKDNLKRFSRFCFYK